MIWGSSPICLQCDVSFWTRRSCEGLLKGTWAVANVPDLYRVAWLRPGIVLAACAVKKSEMSRLVWPLANANVPGL